MGIRAHQIHGDSFGRLLRWHLLWLVVVGMQASAVETISVEVVGGANYVDLPELPADLTTPMMYKLVVTAKDTRREIKNFKLTGSSDTLLTEWTNVTDSGGVGYATCTASGFPVEQWFGTFSGRISGASGGGGGKNGGDGSEGFTLEARGCSRVVIVPDCTTACANASAIPFTAYAPEPDGVTVVQTAERESRADWEAENGQTELGVVTFNFYPSWATITPVGVSQWIRAGAPTCPNQSEAELTLKQLDSVMPAGPLQACCTGSVVLTAVTTPGGEEVTWTAPAGVLLDGGTTSVEATSVTVSFDPTANPPVCGTRVTVTAAMCNVSIPVEIDVVLPDVDPPNYVHDTPADNEYSSPPAEPDEVTQGGWLVLNDNHETSTTA